MRDCTNVQLVYSGRTQSPKRLRRRLPSRMHDLPIDGRQDLFHTRFAPVRRSQADRHARCARHQGWTGQPLIGGARHEKSVDEKESLPQHVAERSQCSGGLSARSGDGGGKARDHRFLDRCASTAETQKEKANTQLTRTACGMSSLQGCIMFEAFDAMATRTDVQVGDRMNRRGTRHTCAKLVTVCYKRSNVSGSRCLWKYFLSASAKGALSVAARSNSVIDE